MLHAYQSGKYVASVNRQHAGSENYRPDMPWLVLHADGKTRKCESAQAARDEVQKVYPGVSFKRK